MEGLPMTTLSHHEIPALVVRQWLPQWDDVRFADDELRRKPEPFFYLFTLSARRLRRLAGVNRRQADRPRAQDPGIQRGHTKERSQEIKRFIRGGFPWSDLSDRQQESKEYRDLRTRAKIK